MIDEERYQRALEACPAWALGVILLAVKLDEGRRYAAHEAALDAQHAKLVEVADKLREARAERDAAAKQVENLERRLNAFLNCEPLTVADALQDKRWLDGTHNIRVDGPAPQLVWHNDGSGDPQFTMGEQAFPERLHNVIGLLGKPATLIPASGGPDVA